jgi:hypothetical protein
MAHRALGQASAASIFSAVRLLGDGASINRADILAQAR